MFAVSHSTLLGLGLVNIKNMFPYERDKNKNTALHYYEKYFYLTQISVFGKQKPSRTT